MGMIKPALSEYLRENGYTIERVSGADFNIVDGHERYEYQLRLNHAPTQDWMEFPYWTGTGITEDPENRPDEIFGMLVRTVLGVYCNPTFEEWASEYGYDSDSRRIEKAYWEIQTAAEEFIRFIGGPSVLEYVALNYERP